eukprot:TRINITY_DN19743_c0_g1::TRINITY_DN19743_c0_g1_i1::g.11302::m.11302 TRINITY_DN19743_c0_g1::TRINITY_DN19743_c0_g1_i1::g.11302  ORF type:complete len:277 (+),score=25.25,sp/Q4KLF3/KTI12_XENLA/40.37/6e-76,KTI12/PF08433.5/6.1e-89,AAA_33/PF13671.1/6.7e-14,AAA_18/PF13238.1/3.3e-09,AAA_17/PF13207.1/9.1e-08,APS_kinase/PF01583.15/1.4e-05,Zeta_toxin/PF06414.7/6.1e-05,AAA/PF00004.24/0.00023,AAA/PF00004.24/4.9e+03,AAA_28/PF13521.1/0.00069,MobB/PF03205.9/0.0022,MobB/PF03205.9/4.8e+03,SRP54/PF00448.17/0.0036,Mg
MPLVLLCGFPCSGKTTLAKRLESELQALGKQVVIVSEDTLNISKKEGYKNSHLEKSTRGTIKSATERAVSKDKVVIVDSLNYIKGYRYELFCLSKSAATTHCVVHLTTPPDLCREYRKNVTDPQYYDDAVFEGLFTRFEEPDPRNRWDNPLFSIIANEDVPMADIISCIVEGKQLRPNQATKLIKTGTTNLLFEMDRITKEIEDSIYKQQSQGAIEGDYLTLPNAAVKLRLERKIPLAELKRTRQAFLRYLSMNPPPLERVGDMFVDHLANLLNEA